MRGGGTALVGAVPLLLPLAFALGAKFLSSGRFLISGTEALRPIRPPDPIDGPEVLAACKTPQGNITQAHFAHGSYLEELPRTRLVPLQRGCLAVKWCLGCAKALPLGAFVRYEWVVADPAPCPSVPTGTQTGDNERHARSCEAPPLPPPSPVQTARAIGGVRRALGAGS